MIFVFLLDVFMDVVARPKYNPVNDMIALMSGVIIDLDKVLKTK